MKASQGVRSIRFGPFAIDESAHELRCNGARVPLQEKQFRLLMALLKRPNEVVTRAELHEALWPEEDFGEFDVGLNQAVRRLRRALGDSAADPKWIETIPKVGYRFVGPLTPEAGYRRAVLAALGAASAGLALVVILLRVEPMQVVASLDVSTFREAALTSYKGQEINPSFSPDGLRIAYAAQEPDSSAWHIYVEEVGSRKRRRITDGSDQNLAPAWSPDNQQLAFIRRSSPSSGASLIVVSLLHGHETKVLDLNCRDLTSLRVDWSPDGDRIVFAGRPATDAPSRIGLVELSSGEVSWLTATPAGIHGDALPVFSPDGSAVAFVRRVGYGAGWIIFVVSLAKDFAPEGEPRQVTEFARIATAPVWAPDGATLFFLGEQGSGQEGIWSVSSAPGGKPQLVWRESRALLDQLGQSMLALSAGAGGETLIAYCFAPARDTDIFRVDLTGARKGEPRLLISTTAQDTHPRVSPDGRRIAFVSGRPTTDLWISDVFGGNLRRLTHLDSVITGPPSWSPDSREIAFHSRPSGTADLYGVDPNTAKVRQLTDHARDEALPAYSRDGKWIYFMSKRSGAYSIWKMPAQGGIADSVVDARSWTFEESLNGEKLYFNENSTGDFFKLSLTTPDAKPERILEGGGSALHAFHVRSSGIYFVTHSDAGGRGVSASGMLCRYDTRNGTVTELFAVEGYVSSVSADESFILTVAGQSHAVDLRMIVIKPADQPS